VTAARRNGWLAALALATAGCLPATRPLPEGLPAAPAELLAEVRATQGLVARVQGEARLDVTTPQGSGGLTSFVAAERPGRLRIDSQDFFGNVLSAVAVDGGRLTLYDARERVFYRGPATARNLGLLVPVALPPEELVTLLCGSAPLLDGAPIDLSPAPGGGALRLTLRRGEALQRVDVGAGAAVMHVVRSRAGVVELEATLSGHQPRGGAPFPGEVQVKAPLAQLELGLRWKSVEVNGVVEASLFTLAPPAGARVVELPPDPP
jgi:hypothetical protein